MIDRVLAASCAVAALCGCEADLPKIPDASGVLDVRCTGPYVDVLVDVLPTSLENGSAALGAPDMASVTLTTDNIVTVGFVGLGGITDAATATDIKIVAMVETGGTAVVRVAGTNMTYEYAGDLNANSNEIDIAVADLTSAIYVRIVGVGGTIRIDAVQAIHDMCR